MNFGAPEVNSGQIYSGRTLGESQPDTFQLPRLECCCLPPAKLSDTFAQRRNHQASVYFRTSMS
jgi:hypothetical protein